MKDNRLLNKIKENWPAKVICFFLAMFFYIFYQISSLDSKTFSVPLTVTDSNGLVICNEIPATVKITLRGKDVGLASLYPHDFSPYINLSYISEEGTYRQPVLVNLSENALLIDPLEVKVKPDYLTVTVEEQVTASVPIHVLTSGKPDYGYEVKDITITPKETLISGARSVVQNYDRLQTQKITIEGASTAFAKNVGLIRNSERITLVDTKPVKVEVNVQPVLETKELKDLVIAYENIPPNFELVKKVEKTDVVLFGKMIDLEKYSGKSNVVAVDCSKAADGEVELPVKYAFPHYIEFAKEPVQSVKLTFKTKTTELAPADGKKLIPLDNVTEGE